MSQKEPQPRTRRHTFRESSRRYVYEKQEECSVLGLGFDRLRDWDVSYAAEKTQPKRKV